MDNNNKAAIAKATNVLVELMQARTDESDEMHSFIVAVKEAVTYEEFMDEMFLEETEQGDA